VKALTVWQPWASAIAEGIKTIETRSWSTRHRGPLAIHAGSKMAPGMAGPAGMFGRYTVDRDGPGEEWYILDSDWPGRDQGQHQYPIYLPLGAVVATANLVDVLPIHSYTSREPQSPDGRYLLHEVGGRGVSVLAMFDADGTGLPTHDGRWPDYRDDLPWGDFTPGRWAWLLADVRKLAEPIPARGRQGLWEWDEAAAEALR
jgi:hypothetical protein